MSTTSRASKEELEVLHAQTTNQIRKALTHAWTDTETGAPIPTPPAHVKNAMEWLKLNGVTGVAVTPKVMKDFYNEAALPFSFQDVLEDVMKRPTPV